MRYIHQMTKAFSKKGYARFFMPGHKGKTGYDRDLTEVDDLDDLACPCGAIEKANKRIARMYGYDWATLGTGGSTGCIHAMLLTSKGKVLIGRDAHKSAINAVYLYNISCDFVSDVSTEGFLKAIADTDASTLYLTYPNYYGDGIDVNRVTKAARAKGMMIISDCAHGAHFIAERRMPALPDSDMLCVSVHKTLGALTGGAAVMCKSSYENRLKDNFFRVHSTSPSYVIMESIDDAYDFVESNPQLMEQWVDNCLEVRKKLRVRDNQDPTRIVISAEGYSGYELFELYKSKGIMAEMADLENVVFLTSPYDIEAIDLLSKIDIEQRSPLAHDLHVPLGGKYKDIFWVKDKEPISIHYKKAEGLVSYKPIGAYPPGTAAVLPGEIITAEVIDYIERILSYGGKLFSVDEEIIKVVEP